MPAPIEFWFDFTSPYGYVASELVDALAARHGRTVRWRPILLGPIFKVVGTGPLTQIPLKGEYSRHDFARTARYHQVAFRLPEKFPVGSQVAARAFYFIDDSDPALAAGFARRVFRAYFAEGRDISDPAVVMEAAAQSGADIPALTQGLAGEAIPASARLMAVADVYDALISRRVYKEAFSHERSVAIIVQGKGQHFDPDIVDAFLSIQDACHAIAEEFSDSDEDLAELQGRMQPP